MIVARLPIDRTKRHRGLTFLEVIPATVVLALSVLAVTWAVSAGQAHAIEAREKMLVTLSAEDKMESILTVPYEYLPDEAGAGFDGQFLYEVLIVDHEADPLNIPSAGVSVAGMMVTVRIRSVDDGSVLSEITTFVPQPFGG